jgi:hypothetical protein
MCRSVSKWQLVGCGCLKMMGNLGFSLRLSGVCIFGENFEILLL